MSELFLSHSIKIVATTTPRLRSAGCHTACPPKLYAKEEAFTSFAILQRKSEVWAALESNQEPAD